MSELDDLYQEVIVDHSKKPRNKGPLEGSNRQGDGYNPLCGDKVTVFLKVADNLVKDVKFEGSGCAISTASASMMTEALKGRTLAEAEALFGEFRDLVTGQEHQEHPGEPPLGKLAVFAGVAGFPARVKCASLAWHTMRTALHGAIETATTE